MEDLYRIVRHGEQDTVVAEDQVSYLLINGFVLDGNRTTLRHFCQGCDDVLCQLV